MVPFSLKTISVCRFWPQDWSEEQAVGFIWSLLRAKPSILDPFRTKFDVFGPDPNFGQLGLDLGGSRPILADFG